MYTKHEKHVLERAMCIEQNLLLHCPCSLGGRKLSEVEHELELGLRSCRNSAGKLLHRLCRPPDVQWAPCDAVKSLSDSSVTLDNCDLTSRLSTTPAAAPGQTAR